MKTPKIVKELRKMVREKEVNKIILKHDDFISYVDFFADFGRYDNVWREAAKRGHIHVWFAGIRVFDEEYLKKIKKGNNELK